MDPLTIKLLAVLVGVCVGGFLGILIVGAALSALDWLNWF